MRLNGSTLWYISSLIQLSTTATGISVASSTNNCWLILTIRRLPCTFSLPHIPTSIGCLSTVCVPTSVCLSSSTIPTEFKLPPSTIWILIPSRKFPNKDMKKEFPNWFRSQIRQRHVDNDSELFALACGPTPTPISVNSCVVNGVRFVVHNRDERRTTQNNGICSPGGKDGEMYYGRLQEILEFSYFSFKVMVNQRRLTHRHISFDLDEDDDIIDDEDALPHDLADSDDEDLINVDEDDVVDVVYSSKGTRKPNLGGRKAGRLHTRQETRNLGLKKITDDKGPVPIQFEWDDKRTIMPLGDHTQFDLKPHMQSQRWTDVNAGIQQHLQKLYSNNKASLKATHFVINLETGTYSVESIRKRRPENNTPTD
nr:hypothetical protein [Tanacetum cinerariifolium]